MSQVLFLKVVESNSLNGENTVNEMFKAIGHDYYSVMMIDEDIVL